MIIIFTFPSVTRLFKCLKPIQEGGAFRAAHGWGGGGGGSGGRGGGGGGGGPLRPLPRPLPVTHIPQ